MNSVLVTGANGHLGFALSALLARRGYRVRASVRNPGACAEQTRCLRELGVELVVADLLDPVALARALAGCEGLFQVAAVYRTHARDPQREIVEPSLVGGLNALRAAQAAGVRRVVFTSSIAALGSDAPPGRPLTELDWNDNAVHPYFQAKTQAERQAWAFAREAGLDLVVINPGAIIGPGFYRHTPTTQPFEMMLRGQLPLAFPTGFTFVDVRDAAQAHLLAYESATAAGRYLAADRYFSMGELMAFARQHFSGIPFPRRVLPVQLLSLAVLQDWLGGLVLGRPRVVTRAMARECGGRYQRASSEKIRRELGWQPMDFRQSLADTFAWIRERFIEGTGNR